MQFETAPQVLLGLREQLQRIDSLDGSPRRAMCDELAAPSECVEQRRIVRSVLLCTFELCQTYGVAVLSLYEGGSDVLARVCVMRCYLERLTCAGQSAIDVVSSVQIESLAIQRDSSFWYGRGHDAQA